MRTNWETLAATEGSLTAALAGLSAVYFLRRHARRRPDGSGPARRTAALALGLSAAGAAALAAHGASVQAGGSGSALLSLLAGLPALAGQALMALLVLRKRGSRQ